MIDSPVSFFPNRKIKRLLDKPYSEKPGRVVTQTSLDSYKQILPKIGLRQQQVYDMLKAIRTDATDSELMTYLRKKDPNYVRPRRNELVKMGFVELARKRECMVTGRRVMCWRIRDD